MSISSINYVGNFNCRAVMEETNSNGKRKLGEARQDEEESSVKRQNVNMAMDVFDCPVCSQPLSPPILQCSLGHFMCSPCRDKLPEPEMRCKMCSRAVSQRCYGMEHVVENILVPCKHGCARKLITYYRQEEHERECPDGPCFCPVSGCGFAGTTAPLLEDHLTALHKWPTTRFDYFVPFELRVRPGPHVLHAAGDGRVFLLYVASESVGNAVSLVCVQPNAPESRFGCSVCFSCFPGHHQVSSLDIRSSSLSDGLPTQRFCVVPKVVSGGKTGDVMLRITIDTEMVYIHDDDLLEEDDDDDSYEEEEEDRDEEDD